MKKCITFLYSTFYITSILSQNCDRQVTSIITTRPFVSRQDYRIIQPQMFTPADHCRYHCIVSAEATKTFRPERITQCLFGDDTLNCQQTLVVSGSHTENRMKNVVVLKEHHKKKGSCHRCIEDKEKFSVDWLADQFLLPTDYKSYLHFKPRVNAFVLTPQIHFNFDPLLKGLFLNLYAPITHVELNLNYEEQIIQRGTNSHDAGYFTPNSVPREQLFKNFTSFVTGKKIEVPDLIFHPLKYAKMSKCGVEGTAAATITTTLGWIFKTEKNYTIGAALALVAPTVSQPTPEFLFNSIGACCFWELGPHLFGTYKHYLDETEDRYMLLHVYAEAYHFFKQRQKRFFDVKGKPNSRYMLLHKLNTPVEDNLMGNGTPPEAQFKQEVSPLANFSALDVDVDISAETDIAALFSYTHKNKSWVIGYRFWKRGCDNITVCNPECFPSGEWAFKGDSHLYGFVAQDGTLPTGQAVTLSSSQSRATITTGKNFPANGTTDTQEIQNGRTNTGIDNPQSATAGSNQPLVASLDDTNTANQINTSIQPKTIHFCDLNLDSARASGTTHTLFMSVHNTWKENDTFAYSLSLGAEIDFGKRETPTPPVKQDACINSALSMWKVHVNFIASFL